jgi:hypothetical protein
MLLSTIKLVWPIRLLGQFTFLPGAFVTTVVDDRQEAAARY